MTILLSVLGMVGLVAVDQILKLLVVPLISDGSIIPIFGDVLVLKYSENTGSAFSLFSGHTEVLTVLTALLLIALPFLYRYMKFEHFWAKLSLYLKKAGLSLGVAGAWGNTLDCWVRGYVVDYIYFTPINFPIFNFADILVVSGVIALAIYVLFFYRPGKEEPAHG